MYAETTLSQFKIMFRDLPDSHGLGIVHVLIGKGASYDVLELVTDRARAKNFTVMSLTSSKPENMVFDALFDYLTERANFYQIP
jgi:hypothetical protein